MYSDKYIFFFVDCNTLFWVERKDFCKFPVYIEIHTAQFILSGSESEPKVKILISVYSCGSAFFQGTYDGDNRRGIFVFESYPGGIRSGISVFIDGTKSKRMFSSEILIEIYRWNLVDASYVGFTKSVFLEKCPVF